MRIRWLVPGLLLFVWMLLATAPAQWVGQLPQTALQLAGFEGTVWRGSAASSRLVGPRGSWELGKLEWELSLLSLLTLTPRIELSSRWGSQRVRATVCLCGSGRLELDRLAASFPADGLQHLLAARFGGVLGAHLEKLVIEDGRVTAARGRLTWERAVWLGPEAPEPLGTYVAEMVERTTGGFDAEVFTLQGQVPVSGLVEVSDRAYRVNLDIGSAGEFSGQLRNALTMIAVPEGGKFELRAEGALQ